MFTGSGLKVRDLWIMFESCRFGVQGLGLNGVGFMVEGLGRCRVYGPGSAV
jgi:hypothetical protein